MLKARTESFLPYVPVLLRLAIGIVFFVHGIQKLQNPGGAIGFMEFLNIPAPAVAGWFIIILESVGGLALIVGVATRYLAILFVVEMLVAILIYKIPHQVSFIATDRTGFELDLTLLIVALTLVILGSGPLSIEHNVLKREL